MAQAQLAQIGRDFGRLVSDRAITPMLENVIRLEDIPDSLAHLSQQHGRGKIVAQIFP
jgi:NADPH:quinone reductase-like Zn-dependent oxidoreductase